jgi:hypothetical protein
MFKRRFRLPSPALVISTVTLSIVLGGTAVAATVSGDKKADTKLVKQLAPSLSVKHATTAAVADSPIAWAHIAASGAVVAGRGITSANVSLQKTSAYCFTGLGFPFKSASVTPDYSTATNAGETAMFALGNPWSDCSSAQAEVATADKLNYKPAGFFIQFYN